MIAVFDKSHVCSVCLQWTAKLKVRHYLYCLCYKRAKGYLHIWLTAVVLTMARLCWLIAIGLSLAILLPLAVPLKLMPVNQLLSPRSALHTDQERIGTEGTVNSSKFAIQSSESDEGIDLISESSRNLSSKQDLNRDLNKDQQKTLNGHNLDSSDTSAHSAYGGREALRQASNAIIESEIEFKSLNISEKDRKFKNKSLSVLSIAQNMRQTNNLNNSNVGSIDSSSDRANRVPTLDSLDLAPGPKSISISRESNGHRVQEVVSGIGIGIQTTGRTAQSSLSRSPAVSVKHEMESQEQKRPEFHRVTAGTPNRKFVTKNSLNSTLNIISNGIYWSKQLESLTPKGFESIDDIRWSHLINSSIVVKMVEGCGRMQNRLITLEDGQMSCARHRQNNDQIQGDIFSFYLARVLGISNLPPATIAGVKGLKSDRYDPRWQRVRTQLHLSKWYKPVVLTQYVNDLVPAFIPQLLRNESRRLHPVPEDIGALNLTELTELVQWSDLIVFDYLTANLDRIVNNMINEKWNPEMMRNPAHNLLKVKNTGLLLFIDNESGLLHGYRLLKKYERQHWSLLSALCVFRERTAKLIESLHKNKNIIYLIKSLFKQNVLDAEAYTSLPFLPEHNIKILYDRISRVYQQINYCKSLYNNNSKL